jgi:hypothetical protein
VAHKAVEPGVRGESGQEILVAVKGLAPGALVIHGSIGPLREGTAVKFTAPPAPAPVAAASKTSP